MYNDRDVPMKGHCVSGIINFCEPGIPRHRGQNVSGRPITPSYSVFGINWQFIKLAIYKFRSERMGNSNSSLNSLNSQVRHLSMDR